MTNDTNTITGALQEIIDRLETNLQNKGVNATYDSTTGILGLVDRISEISQSSGSSGVPCYHVEFTSKSLDYSDWDFTNNRHCAVLEVYLQYQYEPYQNGTVTLTDGVNTYTGTSNANGIIRFTPPVTNNTTTFTVSYTNTQDTFTVEKSTFLFIDDCSGTSNLTSYRESVPVYSSTSGTPACSLTYDSTKNAYDLHSTNTGTSYFSMIPITPLDGKTDFIIEAKIMSSKSYSSNEVGLCVKDSVDGTKYSFSILYVVYYNRYYNRRLSLTSSSVTVNKTLDDFTLEINTWYTLEMKVTDTIITTRLLTDDGDLIHEYSYSQAIDNKITGLIQKGGTVANTTNYVKNIKVRDISE